MKLELKKICKSFGPVEVLHNVDFHVNDNEVHALIGENGAGKSTLVKILTGIETCNSGKILIDGIEHKFNNVLDSEAIGIAIVNQELNLFTDMTVLENLFICKESSKLGIINKKAQIEIANRTLKRLGIKVDLNQPVSDLSIGMQQMLEISKSLILDAKLIVLDEPTSALTNIEIGNLFRVLNLLKKDGKSIIYISHRLNEIFELCDTITILRDGNFVLRDRVKNMSFDDVVKNMVGYDLGNLYPPKPDVKIGNVLLEARNLSKENQFKDVSFKVHEGEIIGFAGLMGFGRTEIMNVLFGVENRDAGEILFKDKLVKLSNVQHAKKLGIGYVTENRKEEGLFLDSNIKQNILYNNLDKVCKQFIINKNLLENLTNEFTQLVNLKFRDLDQLISELSGGNQQKVVLAKWLATNPTVLILDEPTRGIDVNSKKQIYELIFKLKEMNLGVILVSSELVELLGVADKIYVMCEGQIKAEIENKDVSDELIMKYMMGGN